MNKNHPSVLHQLLSYVNTSAKQTNQTDIARALIDHYEQIAELNIHDMADLCFVSSASLSRFVRLLGFNSYPDFKNACEESISIDVDYSFHNKKPSEKDIMPIFERYKNNVITNINFISDHLDYQTLSHICQEIHDAKCVAFFGLEFATLISQHFQIKMAECNKPVKIGLTYKRQEEIARDLPEGSLVLIASLEGGYFYHQAHIVNCLKKKKIPIISFCMYPASHIQQSSYEIITASQTNTDTEGRISLLYIIELLLMNYYILYK